MLTFIPNHDPEGLRLIAEGDEALRIAELLEKELGGHQFAKNARTQTEMDFHGISLFVHPSEMAMVGGALGDDGRPLIAWLAEHDE